MVFPLLSRACRFWAAARFTGIYTADGESDDWRMNNG
jgi:hypothetical protein